MAAIGYYPSFPVKYSNMYNDYSMVTAGLADPFLPQKKEKADKCKFVVSYIGKNEPKFEMNNPHYMREVLDPTGKVAVHRSFPSAEELKGRMEQEV